MKNTCSRHCRHIIIWKILNQSVNAFTFEQLDHFTIMEFQRDINSLSQKEISLVIALLKEQFGASLISDEDEDLNVDNQTLHEELISYMLENAKSPEQISS